MRPFHIGRHFVDPSEPAMRGLFADLLRGALASIPRELHRRCGWERGVGLAIVARDPSEDIPEAGIVAAHPDELPAHGDRVLAAAGVDVVDGGGLHTYARRVADVLSAVRTTADHPVRVFPSWGEASVPFPSDDLWRRAVRWALCDRQGWTCLAMRGRGPADPTDPEEIEAWIREHAPACEAARWRADRGGLRFSGMLV